MQSRERGKVAGLIPPGTHSGMSQEVRGPGGSVCPMPATASRLTQTLNHPSRARVGWAAVYILIPHHTQGADCPIATPGRATSSSAAPSGSQRGGDKHPLPSHCCSMQASLSYAQFAQLKATAPRWGQLRYMLRVGLHCMVNSGAALNSSRLQSTHKSAGLREATGYSTS